MSYWRKLSTVWLVFERDLCFAELHPLWKKNIINERTFTTKHISFFDVASLVLQNIIPYILLKPLSFAHCQILYFNRGCKSRWTTQMLRIKNKICILLIQNQRQCTRNLVLQNDLYNKTDFRTTNQWLILHSILKLIKIKNSLIEREQHSE